MQWFFLLHFWDHFQFWRRKKTLVWMERRSRSGKRPSGCQIRQASFPESPADRTPEVGGFGCYVNCTDPQRSDRYTDGAVNRQRSSTLYLLDSSRFWTKCAWAKLTASMRVVAMRLLGAINVFQQRWTLFLSADEISGFSAPSIHRTERHHKFCM